jgi:hypothetical protein
MALRAPQPSVEQEWVDVSLDQNPQLLSSRLAADIARENVRATFGGHLPTLDIVGTYGKSKGDGSAEFSGLGSFVFHGAEHEDLWPAGAGSIFSGGPRSRAFASSNIDDWRKAGDGMSRQTEALPRRLSRRQRDGRWKPWQRSIRARSPWCHEAGYEVGTHVCRCSRRVAAGSAD